MTPNLKVEAAVEETITDPIENNNNNTIIPTTKKYNNEIVWKNIGLFIYLHVAAFYGLYYTFTEALWQTNLYSNLFFYITQIGAMAGAHRMWSHKAFKAKLPLQIFLCFLQTACFQDPIYEWARNHRVHHKFTDTDADPHNPTRGFFFSHMGWLLVKKHKDVIEKGKTIDMSDLANDPVVRFQRKYYLLLGPLIAFIIPTAIPWYFWNEQLHVAWCVVGMFRYVIGLHGVWLINSAAHRWGDKRYDRHMIPTNNKYVNYITLGEGWHNYHHVFPWDYRSAEMGGFYGGLGTLFIETMAKKGWAYDLKMASPKLIAQRVRRTGILPSELK